MATIIRRQHANDSGSKAAAAPIAFTFSDMQGEASDYIESVRQQAARIIQEAHQEVAQIRCGAEVAGRQAAASAIERILDEKVAKRLETLLPSLESLAAQINDAKGELLAHWEQSALKVSIAIAERIIRRELDHDPQITLDLISEALRLATGTTELTLRLNPTDYVNLGGQAQQLAATICNLAPTSVVADATISPGGCRVETKYGAIDQQVEAQLARIELDLT